MARRRAARATLRWWASPVASAVARAVVLVLAAQPARGLPVYTTPANSTLALVLCRGLDAAVAELRVRELDEHALGAAWLERDCVSIDPCEETSGNADAAGARLPAPAGAWLSGNSSALRLALSAARMLDAEAGVRAENHGSLEFARIPEGLRVQACAPDFDRWRRDGELACNEQTVVTIAADAASRACPGTQAHSLLDCLRPLQFDAGVQTLLRRPPGEKMHFGSLAWMEACAWPANGLAERMCQDALAYSLDVPVAAGLGSTSLVKYEFLEGYACRRASDVETEAQGKVLSRAAAPNRVVSCPEVANGSPVRLDAYTCWTECDAGFARADGGACVSPCAGLEASCEAGWAASATCQQGPAVLYNCSRCPPRAGFGAAAFDPASPAECQYAACAPGTRSVDLACEPCAVNTFSNASGASACASCDSLATGTYQRAGGQTGCHACLWNASAGPAACAPGTELAQSFERVTALFALYSGHGARLEDYIADFCGRGYACLPCEPGRYEADRACWPCPHATYQPNFGSEECYACADGQNTSALGSTRSSDCVCDPGFQ